MTSISSGGGGGYDYVETFYPSDAEEGESLYHLDEDAAYVYTGTEWTEQTVTDHSQLSGVGEDTHFTHAAVAGSGSHTDLSDVTEGDHRSDSRVSDLAPLQSVNGRTGDVTGLFEASDYTPETDTHSRYVDSEARTAVDGSSVSVGYADDAGTLNGQSPSYYETPANTGQTTVEGGYLPQGPVDEVCDGIRVNVSLDGDYASDASFDWSASDADGQLFSGSTTLSPGESETYTYNFDPTIVTNTDWNGETYDSSGVGFTAHIPVVGAHDHTL